MHAHVAATMEENVNGNPSPALAGECAANMGRMVLTVKASMAHWQAHVSTVAEKGGTVSASVLLLMASEFPKGIPGKLCFHQMHPNNASEYQAKPIIMETTNAPRVCRKNRKLNSIPLFFFHVFQL